MKVKLILPILVFILFTASCGGSDEERLAGYFCSACSFAKDFKEAKKDKDTEKVKEIKSKVKKIMEDFGSDLQITMQKIKDKEKMKQLWGKIINELEDCGYIKKEAIKKMRNSKIGGFGFSDCKTE